MRIKYVLKLAGIGLFGLLLVGCAKTNIKKTYDADVAGMSKPTTVLIYNFSINPQAVQQNSSPLSRLQRSIESEDDTAGKVKLANEVADAMAAELIKKIAALGLNPKRADQSLVPTPGSILITGEITKIDEGNSIRRMVIGFGAGQSSLDANVVVSAPASMNNKELISFDAHADSGEKPGAIVMGPAGAAVGAGTAATVGVNAAQGVANTYKSASAHQAEDLAEKITVELAKYFAKQGWINPDLVE